MCRNIKTLYNFDPPATPEEINLAALQFVRKLTGFKSPSKQNEKAFNLAIMEIAKSSEKLLNSLTTNAPQKDRDIEAAKNRLKSASRFPQR